MDEPRDSMFKSLWINGIVLNDVQGVQDCLQRCPTEYQDELLNGPLTTNHDDTSTARNTLTIIDMPLHLSVIYGSHDVTVFFISEGVDIAQSNDGNNAIHALILWTSLHR